VPLWPACTARLSGEHGLRARLTQLEAGIVGCDAFRIDPSKGTIVIVELSTQMFVVEDLVLAVA
jgi:hypothetical protein